MTSSARTARGRRTGRPPGSPPNRAAILESARAQFTERGYDGATIRGIAAGAGVDPALVHHYFGTKDQLLLATLTEAAQVDDAIAAMLTGGLDGLGERFLRATFETYETTLRPMRQAIVGLVRTAVASEDAARLLRERFAGGGLVRLLEALDASQPRLRAALVGGELFGLALARFVVRVEPIASADIESIVAWYAPTIQRHLTGPLPGD